MTWTRQFTIAFESDQTQLHCDRDSIRARHWWLKRATCDLFCFSRHVDRYSVLHGFRLRVEFLAIGALNRTVGDGRDGEPHPMVTS
jgi:hypothetical protein